MSELLSHAEFVPAAHAAGIAGLRQVGSVEAAVRAQQAGVDVIIAQGIEAGGHVVGEVSTMVLLPRIVDAVAPALVLAAGGIADARGLAAALCLGADAVVIGTRFLATPEAKNIHAAGDIASMSLLAGQSVGLVHEIRPAAEILFETVSGADRPSFEDAIGFFVKCAKISPIYGRFVPRSGNRP